MHHVNTATARQLAFVTASLTGLPSSLFGAPSFTAGESPWRGAEELSRVCWCSVCELACFPYLQVSGNIQSSCESQQTQVESLQKSLQSASEGMKQHTTAANGVLHEVSTGINAMVMQVSRDL